MKRLLFFILVLANCSCAPKIYLQDAYLLENESRDQSPDNRVDIKCFYGGDHFDYITFQIDVDNRSSDTITLNENDITLFLEEANGLATKFYPIPKDAFISRLSSEAFEINREKKVNVTANIIFSGLDILGAIASGANTAEAVIYSTGTAADIMAQRQGYEEAEMSLEELIAYHENYTLDNAVLLPGESGTYDIHFTRLMVDGYCELELYCTGQTYGFEYDLEVIEVKR